MRPLKIAILMHEMDERRDFGPFSIDMLAPFWREDGHEVFHVYGTSKYVPADVVIVHVDLSVVPEAYLEFARRYPIVINGAIRDIRKTTFSDQVVTPADAWNGPVIVKTNDNYGGMPEQIRNKSSLIHRAARRLHRIFDLKRDGLVDYPIFANRREVPRRYFSDSRFIVERFCPEVDAHGLYCTRSLLFLGERSVTLCLRGQNPIVTAATAQSVEEVSADPEMLRARERLRIDYGKLDYVIVNGRPILLDVNKTVGATSRPTTGYDALESRRHRAQGLYDYVR